jgi:hypothetical protein
VSSIPSANGPAFNVSEASTPWNPAIGLDTTFLEAWEGRSVGCQNQYTEWRAVSLSDDGQPVGTRGDTPNARSLYVSWEHEGWIAEHEPLVAFRPHRNTRESINLEGYTTNGWCDDVRVFGGIQWWWFDNGVRKFVTNWYTDNFTNRVYYDDGAELKWTPVDYSVASHKLFVNEFTPPLGGGSVVGAGDTAFVLSDGDFAANGVEIYNGAARSWAVANPTLARIKNPAGHLVATSFGPNWQRQSTEAAAMLAGSTTVTAGNDAFTLLVLPTISVSGPSSLPSTGGALFTASAVGCNTTCEYSWSVVDNGRTEDMGTGATIRIYSDPAWQTYVKVNVTATSNGVTGKWSKQVRNYGSGCGAKKIC